MKKIFGNINLTWKKLIIWAITTGIYTGIMISIPALRYTSFSTIAQTFEIWILFGILIIMNSKSNKDAALKCFIFFLISEPLVYLVQVPFSWQGWNLFQYYKYWFIWTCLCIPMGYIGYYIKKDKWWGYLILLPMILLTAYEYYTYFLYFLFSYPKYILISLFCIIALIIYPLLINNKIIKRIGLTISIILILVISIICLKNPIIYNREILAENKNNTFDKTYKVYIDNPQYGKVKIKYDKNLKTNFIYMEFKREGNTILTLESPEGKKVKYSLKVKRDTYKIDKITKKNNNDKQNKK